MCIYLFNVSLNAALSSLNKRFNFFLYLSVSIHVCLKPRRLPLASHIWPEVLHFYRKGKTGRGKYYENAYRFKFSLPHSELQEICCYFCFLQEVFIFKLFTQKFQWQRTKFQNNSNESLTLTDQLMVIVVVEEAIVLFTRWWNSAECVESLFTKPFIIVKRTKTILIM